MLLERIPAMNDRDTPEYLRDATMYGPTKPIVAPKLRGWWTPNGWYVCGHCAGRIVGRGCAMPAGVMPVWVDNPEPYGVCCVCADADDAMAHVPEVRAPPATDRAPMPKAADKRRCARCRRTASRKCRYCPCDLCRACTCPDCTSWAKTMKAQRLDGPATWTRYSQEAALNELRRDLRGTTDNLTAAELRERIRVLERLLENQP